MSAFVIVHSIIKDPEKMKVYGHRLYFNKPMNKKRL